MAIENLKEKELKTQIDNLTLKQLKGTIFQIDKWWLILIINAVVTLIIAVLVALIVNKMGL